MSCFDDIQNVDELPRCPICLNVAIHNRVKMFKYPNSSKVIYRCTNYTNHDKADFGAKQYVFLKQDQKYLICLSNDTNRKTCDCDDCQLNPTNLPVELICRPSHKKFLQEQKLTSVGNDYINTRRNKKGTDVAYESKSKIK